MNIRRILATTALLLLAACGGGGTTPATQTVSGKVLDGYLTGATVCLDTNNNKRCDGGEPTGTTGANGTYTIANVSVADLMLYPILVEVPAGAVDSDRGTVTSGYVLTAPAGQPAVISPLTTLVQSQMENNGLSLADAVATVKTQLNLTVLSPLDDYQPGVAGAGAEAVLAAGIAKVVASSIANNESAIETAIGSGSSVSTREVINLSIQQIAQNLPEVAMQVQGATNNGRNVLAENKVAGIVSSSGTTVSTSDSSELQQQLAAAGTTSSATGKKLILALQGSGAGDVQAIQATITFPAGVVLRADAAGLPMAGVLTATGTSANAFITGKFTAATAGIPASLTLGLVTTNKLGAGDVIAINTILASGITVAPAASAFTISASKLSDTTGNSVGTASLLLK